MKCRPFIHEGFQALHFECPGCACSHWVWIEGPKRWQYNGNPDSPTFSPSILVNGNTVLSPGMHRCHFYVREGTIAYLSDCTHHLAGKTILPELDMPTAPGNQSPLP